MDKFTRDQKFVKEQRCRENEMYANIWIDYANSVQDSKLVYKYMMINKIGTKEAKTYLNMALDAEKYYRDFDRTVLIYKKALKVAVKNDRDYKLILKHALSFSDRMKRRTARDLIIHF